MDPYGRNSSRLKRGPHARPTTSTRPLRQLIPLILLLGGLPLLAALVLGYLHMLGSSGTNILPLAVIVAALVIVVRSIRFDTPEATLDREIRRHSRLEEWRDLFAVEETYSAPERRLLLAREFRRLAADLLAVKLADRGRWPSSGRLAALRRQSNLLLASATDPVTSRLPETAPTDPLTNEALAEAIRALAQYASLLATVCDAPNWDPEATRMLARERDRLTLASDRIITLITD